MMNQKFVIFPEDEKVIEAAIKLGDWIACQPETTNEEKAIVQEVQAALRKLPEVTFGLSADYEFSATSIELENWDGNKRVLMIGSRTLKTLKNLNGMGGTSRLKYLNGTQIGLRRKMISFMNLNPSDMAYTRL
ncbi:hypothetical protein [Methylobacter tundripaludum]|uniref:Uncharacterized protein n=1 Tax=Methylobacter tundripaludum (strain ATCC BAA-1195 / DSM 17260 / SV96) TaxID=697282 RepID=G3IXF4_METTV|nr:hypothetical protein [Methylobacter tundripaludum]EGW23211.1 hypothetical protein Mettu_2056 [Methylobacter tundripaludum SV96]